MITPLVNEAEWLRALSAVPIWTPPATPMLMIAPHPDDETLGAGGLIKAQRLLGLDVMVAAVTDGENAYAGAQGLGVLRRREQAEASARLGVESERIMHFGLPDSDVASREDELTERLMTLISEDTHVIAPWEFDFHPDHKTCGRAAQKAAGLRGAAVTWYFFWTWHFGTVEGIAGLSLRRFGLNAELLRAKSEALACHRTQLTREEGAPVLPELLLAPARRPFEIFAAA